MSGALVHELEAARSRVVAQGSRDVEPLEQHAAAGPEEAGHRQRVTEGR